MYYDERGNFFDYTSKEKNEYINFDINNYNYYNLDDNKTELFDSFEGFNKGNLFHDLYSPYKNHDYMLKVSGERDNLLLKIQVLDFALNDLNLYLDLYPNDTKCINIFNDYNKKNKECIMEFEKKYGPLTVCGLNYDNEFSWINNPWPWDKGGNL